MSGGVIPNEKFSRILILVFTAEARSGISIPSSTVKISDFADRNVSESTGALLIIALTREKVA